MKKKKHLINRLMSDLKFKNYQDIEQKPRESETDHSFAPNVLAYKDGKLYIFDVKAQLTDKVDFLIKKWKYLSEIAHETGATFRIIVPKGKEQIADFIARHNNINVHISTA